MWAAVGIHGNQWTYANVILSNTAPFRVTFQAEVGGDMWTDIALDDVSYTAECVVGGKRLFICLFFIVLLLFSTSSTILVDHFSVPSPLLLSFFSLLHIWCATTSPASLKFPHKQAGPSGGVGRKLMEPVTLWIQINSLWRLGQRWGTAQTEARSESNSI